MGTVLIQGCGISAIVNTKEGAEYWIGEIVAKNGVPVVTAWNRDLQCESHVEPREEGLICVCGDAADPIRLSMCKACFDEWVEVKTASWLRASRRKLEAFRLREAA